MKKGGKRRDAQRRVLRTGEYQRPNGLYEYRFMDASKKRRSIYERDLKALRQREEEIAESCRAGLHYNAGSISVLMLLERYQLLKRNVRYNTAARHQYVYDFVKKRPEFGKRSIRDIRVSDAKLWIISLYDEGYAFSTISSIKSFLRCAFQMAYEEDILRRNPFDFRMDIIPNNSRKVVALTDQQQKQFMDFVAGDSYDSKYWDEFNILLGTGMRVSEFCGLTKSDLDFEKRRIRIDHQLVRTRDGERYIEKTKTAAGCRYVPMSQSVYRSLLNLLNRRTKPRQEPMVDGYTGFLLLDQNCSPKVASHIEHAVNRIWKKYNAEHAVQLPRITPHVFRHTFCTNMANAGMDLKSLQYLMGHTDASVTMNVYSHNSYEYAEKAMAQIVSL